MEEYSLIWDEIWIINHLIWEIPKLAGWLTVYGPEWNIRSINGLIGTFHITHSIHGAGIYANIWGILMVNVTIYSIHGSYGNWGVEY